VDFQTQAGRTYQIRVDGWGGYHLTSMGNVVLNLNFTANSTPGAIPGGDDFSRRGILSGLNAAGVANNTDFVSEGYELIPLGNKNTARWEWTAPESCAMVIDTFGSDFDTVLHLFTGRELESLTTVTSNDNVAGAMSSKVEFLATKGVTYQIMVNGRSLGRRGNIALNLNRVLSPEVAIQQPIGNNLKDELSKSGFGKVKIRSKSGVRKYTIRNTGTATLDGLAIRRTGTHATDFLVYPPGRTSLAPGESTTFSVVFAPKARGKRIGAVQIMSNDADENPFTIILMGEGKR
jgi:hypothetical protein